MIGLATRVAYSLQLHREEAYTSLSFYQGQIYRMCWAVLLGLDYQASFDRGSDPCNAVDSWNTKPPLNLNDDEWGVDTDKNTQWPERREPTDMIFMMIATTCARLVRELSFVPVSRHQKPPSPLPITSTNNLPRKSPATLTAPRNPSNTPGTSGAIQSPASRNSSTTNISNTAPRQTLSNSQPSTSAKSSSPTPNSASSVPCNPIPL